MHLIVVGLNHRSAPIEVRERVTFPETKLADALRALVAYPTVTEAAILSTCNRTELYAAAGHADSDRRLVQFIADTHDLAEGAFASHLYVHRDTHAVRHLLRVASGLDSLVLGEPQILKQVRDAFAAAADTRAAGNLLNGLFRAAIATGKRARTETDIGRGGFSIGHAAVDLASSIFGSLSGATILILGAGKMSELTARHLVANGSNLVLVANRTHAKAQSLAERLGGKAIHYDGFPDAMVSADIVISSTASPVPVVRRDMLGPVMRRRRGRPLFLIDIAVPRDVEPDVASLDNVFLYDVDDLEEVVADMARERAGEADRVEAIVSEETERFAAWWRALDAAPLVASLRDKHEAIRESELERLRNQLPELPERAWRCIEAASRSMMTRVGRDPINRLKDAASAGQTDETWHLMDAARYLFCLPAGGCPALNAAASGATDELAEADGAAALAPDAEVVGDAPGKPLAAQDGAGHSGNGTSNGTSNGTGLGAPATGTAWHAPAAEETR